MDEEYFPSIKEWRKAYETKLGAPDGWLSISGLYWLSEGDNRMGADPKSEVALPLNSAPLQAAVFHLADSQITMQASGTVEITCGQQPVSSIEIRLNEYGSSEPFFLNDLKFFVIQRGTRFGVRVYDKNNPARRKYHNIRWFPVDEKLRIPASFVALDPPMVLSISSVVGTTSDETCPGYVEFELNGKAYRLYPIWTSDNEQLWFLFKDASGGSLSYGGGRFLMADRPQDGIVLLDFNKAYNPPCAYTDFATCPLPPTINTLPVSILAGEMSFIGH